jgi:hypothetical protein
MGCERSGRSACLEETAPEEVIAVLEEALERILGAPAKSS